MYDQTIIAPDVLVDDGELVLSRVVGRQDSEAALLLTPSHDCRLPSARVVERFANAMSLRALLNIRGVARPRRLIELDGQPALVLDDPGGLPLAGMLGAPWPLKRFLDVARALAAALAGLHRHDLIVRDVRPATILVTDQNSVALTRFGMASVASDGGAAPDPSVLAMTEVGSLIYIAPELTGRMSRGVDKRCDLYSLGVVLYQMLTGELPFDATTAAEWIHSHMTRQPAPIAMK